MNDCLILLQDEFPLQQRALHELAKTSWDNLLIKEKECVFILRDTEKLIAHREKVLNNVSETLKRLPKRLQSKLINAVFCLQHGYSEAVTWELKCKSALPFSIFDPVAAGEYQIDNFLDPSGHFKELEWAKRFVGDEEQYVVNRFVLACFYCFDKAIENLWHTMKINRQFPYEGCLPDIKLDYQDDDLVVIWAYQLEDKFSELMEESNIYVNGFSQSGLFDAILMGHEYAARYFWNRLSGNEKTNFLRKPEFALVADAAEGNHTGLVSFIYSLLKEEQKQELISWTIEDDALASILCCLLQSRYYESVLSDLLKPPFPIPTKIYKWILISLSFEIAELQNPVHKMIFEKLWKYLSQSERNEVLEENSFIIMNLVRVKAMDLLKMIIQPLSHSKKDRMLLHDWQRAGISALDDFSYRGDYDDLGNYLFIFLMDYCPKTQKTSLRSDAPSLFDKFIKSEKFIKFIDLISDSEEEKLNKFIEEFQDSLKVPFEVLEEEK